MNSAYSWAARVLLCAMIKAGRLQLLNDRGDRKGLAGAGGAQQNLVLQAALDAFDQLSNGFRLIAGGLEGGV